MGGVVSLTLFSLALLRGDFRCERRPAFGVVSAGVRFLVDLRVGVS